MYSHIVCVARGSRDARPQSALPVRQHHERRLRLILRDVDSVSKGQCLWNAPLGAMLEHIAAHVQKPGGAHLTQKGARKCIEFCKERGGVKWDGVPGHDGRGRQREAIAAEDHGIRNLVFKHRGSVKVTVQYAKQKLPKLRRFGNSLAERRLREFCLQWLRRRKRSWVPSMHKKARLDSAKWVLGRTAPTLARWIYTDGTTFYLART